MGFWNIAGLMNKDKDFWEYIQCFDFIGLTETWIEERQWDKWENKLPSNFVWKCSYATREHKKGRAIGGIITGIKKNIKEKTTPNTHKNMQERTLIWQKEAIKVITIYNTENLNTLQNILQEADVRGRKLIIGGDFNVRTGEKGGIIDRENGIEIKRKSKDKIINKEGEKLIEIIENNGWTILNGNTEEDTRGEFTYIGPRGQSVIDYGIVNEEGLDAIKSFKIGNRIESDHQPIIIELKNVIDARDENNKREVVNWREDGVLYFKEKSSQVEIQNQEINDAANELVDKLRSCLSKTVVSGKHRTGTNSWWGKKCREKKRIVTKMLKKWKRGEVTREEFLKEKKEHRGLCLKMKKEEEEKEKEKINNIRNETEIWKYINSDRKKSSGAGGKIEIEEWSDYFRLQLEGDWERKIINFNTEEETSIEEEITTEEVQLQIKRLKKKKAAGEDRLQNEVWINSSQNISEELTKIFNCIFRGKGFPQRWRKGIISPIHKKGEKDKVDNYRGITLLDTAYKIYAMVLEKRLMRDVEEKQILHDSQAGFRKERGTIDNIYTLNYAVQQEISRKQGKLYAMFADLKAAFDKVNREKLIEKLKSLKVNKTLITKIAEIYEETKNTIKVNNEESREFWTTKGLRQGCPLSPLLFSIYMSDLETVLSNEQTGGVVIGQKKIWSLSYADDIVIVAKTHNEMKALIRRFGKYLSKIDMILNTKKTKIIKFSKGRGRAAKEDFEHAGEQIEMVKTIKYLGYTFQKNGGEKEHIKEITKRANIAMTQAWSIGQRKFKNNFKMRMFLFDKLVVSILMYGAEVWGWTEQTEIETTQTKYIKWILGLNRQTPSYIILEETKRNRLRIEASRRAMKYEEKIGKTVNKELLRECYRVMKRKETAGQEYNKWEEKRKKFYENQGYSTTEIDRIRNMEESITSTITARSKDIEIQERRQKIEHSRYCPRYKYLITMGEAEYLEKENKNMITIARYRVGNEELSSEYWKEEEDKKCQICGSEPETMEHILRDCSEELRCTKSSIQIFDHRKPDVTKMKKIKEKRKAVHAE